MISYDYLDANHKRDRAAFYNKWEKRKEKDKHTCLSVSDAFNGRIGLEFSLFGIAYETDTGFIFNWDVLNFSLFSKSISVASSMFSIGYNFNKLMGFDRFCSANGHASQETSKK